MSNPAHKNFFRCQKRKTLRKIKTYLPTEYTLNVDLRITPDRFFDPRRYFPIAWGGGGSYVAPHAATHVPLARSGYATTSSVLAIVWSLVRSTVSSTTPVALSRRASNKGARRDDIENRPVSC